MTLGIPHYMVLMSIVVPLVHWIVKTLVRYFSKNKITGEIQVCYPPAVVKFIKESRWVSENGPKAHPNTVGIRMSRHLESTLNQESKIRFEVVAPMEGNLQQAVASNAATQISQWIEDAEKFDFVGHSDYMTAIIPFLTLNFTALCPNLTQAHINGLITTTAFRMALATLQNIKDLDIGMVIEDVVGSVGTTPTLLRHYNLKTLKLRSNVSIAALLRDTKLEKLESLDLWLGPQAAFDCKAENFSFVGQNGCDLSLNFDLRSDFRAQALENGIKLREGGTRSE